ncbi:Tartrate-resistant acid phosphatase type 5 [Aphelenchoides bicaudatus]|nr:Tartrate-resistant acid phosphatase type 5 [Aphelenchoides bicaudatus]
MATHLLQFLLAFCGFCIIIGLTPEERMACTRGLICAVNKDQIDLFVVGDTGGVEYAIAQGFPSYVKPTTVQTRVADAMAKLAAKKGLDFVINVGDNVYFNGVDHENDTRFYTVFEKPYSHKHLNVPWYMIAGNHDYLGNVDAQINYTKYSNKWTFPDRWYKLNYAFSKYQKKVDFLFIDTVILCGNTIDIDSRSVFAWATAFEKEPKQPDKQFIDAAKEQWKWLEEELKDSEADFLFVVGHYPMYSLSMKRLKCLYDKLDPLLRKYQVTAYIAGHDHSVQYFRDDGDPDKNRGPMRYLVSGAGSRTSFWDDYGGDENTHLLYRYPKKAELSIISIGGRYMQQKNEFGYGQGGFVHFTVQEHRADLYFYAKDLVLEFQESIPARNIAKLPKFNSKPKSAKAKKGRRKRDTVFSANKV